MLNDKELTYEEVKLKNEKKYKFDYEKNLNQILRNITLNSGDFDEHNFPTEQFFNRKDIGEIKIKKIKDIIKIY